MRCGAARSAPRPMPKHCSPRRPRAPRSTPSSTTIRRRCAPMPRAADAARARSAPLGALHGVPLALKDNLDTAAMPTTGGTPGLRGHRPKQNGAVVQKLLDAGAIVFGKTNLHELAYGITNNNAAFGAGAQSLRSRAASPAPRAAASASRWRRGWRRAASARTPAARCGFRRRCAASSASGRRPGAGRRPASCRSRTPATPPGR